MDPNPSQPGGVFRHTTNLGDPVPEVRSMIGNRGFFENAIFTQDAKSGTLRLMVNGVVVVGLIKVNDVLREVSRQLTYEPTKEIDKDQILASNSVSGPRHEPSAVGMFKEAFIDLNKHTGKAQLTVDRGKIILHGAEDMNNFLRQTARKLQEEESNKHTQVLKLNHNILEGERGQSPNHSQVLLLSPSRILPTIEESSPDTPSSAPEADPGNDDSVRQVATSIVERTSAEATHKTFQHNRDAHDCQMRHKLARELNELARFNDECNAGHELGRNHQSQVSPGSDEHLVCTGTSNKDAQLNTAALFPVDFPDCEEQTIGSKSKGLSKSTVGKEIDPSLSGRATAIAAARLSGVLDGLRLGSIRVVLNATDLAVWRQSNIDAEAIAGAQLAGVEDAIKLNLVEAVPEQEMKADTRVIMTTSDALRLNRENESCQTKLAQALLERDEAVRKLVENSRNHHETQTSPQIDDLLSHLAEAQAKIDSVSRLRDDAIVERDQAHRNLATRTGERNRARRRVELLNDEVREGKIREVETRKQLEGFEDQEKRSVVLKDELTCLQKRFNEQLNAALVKSEEAKRVVEAQRDHYYEQVAITNAAIRKAQEDLRITTARAESLAGNVCRMRLELESARLQTTNLEDARKRQIQELTTEHQRQAARSLEVVQHQTRMLEEAIRDREQARAERDAIRELLAQQHESSSASGAGSISAEIPSQDPNITPQDQVIELEKLLLIANARVTSRDSTSEVQAVNRVRNSHQDNTIRERRPSDGFSGVPPSRKGTDTADPQMPWSGMSRTSSPNYEAPKARKRKANNDEFERLEKKRR